jgi:hypothetical protein
MPRQYEPHQKTAALDILAGNGGDITQAHLQTGIPQRTLYHWRSELWQTWRQQAPPPPSPKPLPEFEDDLDALGFVRHKIMRELLNIANNYPEGIAYTTPIQRTAQFSQLLTRLMELDEHLQPYKPVETEFARIIYGFDAGLYLRTDKGYRGPYTPEELPPDWKQLFGSSTRIEMYWGDHTFSILPDDVLQTLFDIRDFNDEPCELVDTDEDEYSLFEEKRYGWRYG